MTKTSVIIPYYGRYDLVHARLMEIYQNVLFHHKDTLEIILINDCSPDLEDEGGVAFWQKLLNKERKVLRYHKNDENLGFGGAMGIGVKMAEGENVVLYSNDVIGSYDFVGEVEQILDGCSNILLSGEMIDYPAGWNEFQFGNKKIYIPYCNGWLIACRKDVWKRLGGFDPRYGHFDVEDVDLSTKALELGIELKALNNKHLQHIGGATIYALYPERQQHTIVNREKYIAKWGDKLLQLGKIV